MRRYLAFCLEKVPGIFRMLVLIAREAQGHGPVHLFFILSAELGFAWMVMKKVVFGFPSLPFV